MFLWTHIDSRLAPTQNFLIAGTAAYEDSTPPALTMVEEKRNF
jgi:hypothetical protein